jgi:hypothetical protein
MNMPRDALSQGFVSASQANDAKLWSSAFGGVESLESFWKNLALM